MTRRVNGDNNDDDNDVDNVALMTATTKCIPLPSPSLLLILRKDNVVAVIVDAKNVRGKKGI